MKKILKKFPLTIYSIAVVAMTLIFVIMGEEQRDDLSLLDPVFWIFVFGIPLNLVGKIFTWFDVKYSLLLAIPIFFFIDLFFLFLRTKLIPRLILKFAKKPK